MTEKLKIYGVLASPFVARCMIQFRAKGLEADMEIPADGIKTPDFLALNPMGRIPTLIHGEVVLPESATIMEYIEDCFPEPPTLPDDHVERARARLLRRLVDIYAMPHVITMIGQMRADSPDQTVVDQAYQSLRDGLGYLDALIQPGPFAVGDRLSQAGCTVIPLINLLPMVLDGFVLDDPVKDFSKLSKWWKAVQSDELCAEMLEQINEAMAQFRRARAAQAAAEADG